MNGFREILFLDATAQAEKIRQKEVRLVNFWANRELDEYIDLEVRVTGRMVLLEGLR